MGKSFYSNSKKIDNTRMRIFLERCGHDEALEFPTYREGLKAIHDDEGAWMQTKYKGLKTLFAKDTASTSVEIDAGGVAGGVQTQIDRLAILPCILPIALLVVMLILRLVFTILSLFGGTVARAPSTGKQVYNLDVRCCCFLLDFREES